MPECEYTLDAVTEILLLREDIVDIISGLIRDSSLSALLPFISRKSVDISPSERQPSVNYIHGK